jgi:hypothetical protein
MDEGIYWALLLALIFCAVIVLIIYRTIKSNRPIKADYTRPVIPQENTAKEVKPIAEPQLWIYNETAMTFDEVINRYGAILLEEFASSPLFDEALLPLPKIDMKSFFQEAIGVNLTNKNIEKAFSFVPAYYQLAFFRNFSIEDNKAFRASEILPQEFKTNKTPEFIDANMTCLYDREILRSKYVDAALEEHEELKEELRVYLNTLEPLRHILPMVLGALGMSKNIDAISDKSK